MWFKSHDGSTANSSLGCFSGAQQAADLSAVNASSLSASSRQQLIGPNASRPPDSDSSKRTADSAGLTGRPPQASKDSHDSHMADEMPSDDACSTKQLGLLTTTDGRMIVMGKENGKVCKDDSCRGICGHHEASCKVDAILKVASGDRSGAIKKTCVEKMQKDSESILAIGQLVKSKYLTNRCKTYMNTGITHKEGYCPRGPCCDWEEMMENELADSVYKDLPDSLRKDPPGKPARVRGSRGGQKLRETEKVNKENNRSWGEESNADVNMC